MKTLAVYKCWGCLSVFTDYVEFAENLLSAEVEVWNLCPDCLEAPKKGDKKIRDTKHPK